MKAAGICLGVSCSFLLCACTAAYVPADSGLLVVIVTICAGVFLFVFEKVRRAIRGYYVYMTGGVDGGDVRYVENGKEVRLCFTRKDRTIYVPSAVKWNEIMPEWAKPERDEIIARIRKRVSRTWHFKEVNGSENIRAQSG
jgi:hypothetical protein